MEASGRVVSVSAGPAHGPHKPVRHEIELVAGFGIAGDAHFGRTVQHLSRARAHPDWDNLRQVHLIGAELHEELHQRGFSIDPGEMGENILTSGVNLLDCSIGTTLRIGQDAVIELTGLRNPCSQLNSVQAGLMDAVLDRTQNGTVIRRAGVMSIVKVSGLVRPHDPISVEAPLGPRRPLRPV